MTGTVTLSLEVELAWGLINLPEFAPERRISPGRRRETETLHRLLELCDDLKIPISFDVIGHLLLDSCAGDHDGPYDRGWFGIDPGTDRERDPLFYAPDLVQDITATAVEHELCTHSFSHIRCDEVDPELVEWELETVGKVHRAAGYDRPQSFVPPIHGPPPYDVLREEGMLAVRVPEVYRPPVAMEDQPDSRFGRTVSRVTRSHPVQVLFRTHPVVAPRIRDGLVESVSTWHASLSAPFLPNGQQPPHPAFRLIPTTIRQWIHRRYLRRGVEAAIRRDSYAHFWSHLFNISNDIQWPLLRDFLDYLAAKRDEGLIEIETMATIGQEVGDRARA